MQRLNLKLVISLVAAGLIVVVAMYFLHGFQMTRTAVVLQRQAQEAAEEGENQNKKAAVNYYTQYLSYRPDDTEAATTRAFLLADLAEQDMESRNEYAQSALSALEDSLRNDSTNNKIRERLVDFASYAGRPQDSIIHIEELRKERPDDPELLAKLGACQARTGRPQEGAENLRKAIELGDVKEDTFVELAITLRSRLERGADADKAIEDMVLANPNSAKAYLRRSQWLRETQRSLSETEAKRVMEQIQADVAKALELDPENADAMFAAGQMAAMQADLGKVKELMNKAHELHPKDERMVQMLVEVAVKENRLDDVDELVSKMPESTALKLLQFEVKLQGLDKEAARKIVDSLEGNKTIDPRNIEFMRARLLGMDGDWLKASQEFERLRKTMPALKTRIDMILGHCYEVLRQPDKQLEAYKSALGAAPNSLEALIGYGRALQAVGQNAEALKVFQSLKQAMKPEDFVKLVVARNSLLNLLIDQISRLPEDQRDWTEIDELMAASKSAFPDATDLLMTDAKILEHKGNSAEAKQLLEKSLAKDPKNISTWLSMSSLAFAKDGAEGALKVLDEAQAAVGDVYELRAMRISCAAQLPVDECKKMLAEISQIVDNDKTMKPEQTKVLRQMIGANYFRLHDFVLAREIWQKIFDADPTDQQALLVLFDIGINEQDDAKVVETIKAIKYLLGADSPEAKYIDVRRNLFLLRQKKIEDVAAVLKDARRKIREAAEQRPRWNALPRIEAEIDMFQNRPDDAITNLQKAMEYGATDYTVVRQLAELLTLRGRGSEAQELLARAQARAPSKEVGDTSDMIDISIALGNGKVEEAIRLLEQALSQDPNDVRKIVLLGQVKSGAARYDEAEALFRDAVDKDPNFPTSWQELVKLLRDQRRETDAREVINLALEKISKPQNELIAGQCCELLGDIEGAEEHLEKAREQQPNDLGLTRAMAMFYARQRDPLKVRKELDRMLAAKPATPSDKEQIAWANREVAIIIAGRGAYSDMNEALARLNPKDPNDKATMAALLAGRPEAESRLKAVKLLEEVKAVMPLTADSRLVLAKLYDSVGDWSRSKDEMVSLVASYKDEPKYLAAFVEMLTEHNDLGDAGRWMDDLEKLAPDTPVTSAVKAKLLVKQGKPEEAVAVLRALLPHPMPKEMFPTLLQVAQLLESLELNEAAEPMYREYQVLNPRGALELAGFLGRHGTLKDALDMCESAMDTLPRESVLRAAMQILHEQHSSATSEDYARVEKWISQSSAQNPKSLLLKLIYAELLDMQQHYPQLEEYYKGLLANPAMVGQSRAVVLNNLAFLMAVQNRPGESKEYIDEAIQIFGPTSDLLDTRALVQMAHNDPKQAIADLDMATVDQPTGLKYFHLAQAHLMNKDTHAATEAMKKALETYKLTRKELAPVEQPKFDSMMAELGLSQ